MKRVISALVLLLALGLTLTGCSDSAQRQARKEALNILNGTSTTSYALSTGTTMEGQTLYSDGDVIIQLGGLQGTPEDPKLVLAIRNGTRSDIYFSVESLIFNNWQVDGWSDPYEIDSRSVALATVSCNERLTGCGVEDIYAVGLSFSVYDDGYEDLAASSVTMSTSAQAPDAQEDSPEGIVLLEESGFVVKATGVQLGESGRLTLYLENNTDRTVYLETLHVRVNGAPVELWIWDKLSPGVRRLSSQGIYEEDTYDAVPLAEGDVLTFDLEVQDYYSGGTLATQSVTLDLSDFA